MRHILRSITILAMLIVAGGMAQSVLPAAAQDATPTDSSSHPIVGTWIVDTATAFDTDPPEIGIFHGDGTMVRLGANVSAGGSWEVIDDRSVLLTLVTVSDQDGVGVYFVIRGTYVLDDTGNHWTCDDCAYTLVSADGTDLDSGILPASGTRLPVQSPHMVGSPLDEVPTWTPLPPGATPAA